MKKLLALLLTLVMILSLTAACEAERNRDDDEKTPASDREDDRNTDEDSKFNEEPQTDDKSQNDSFEEPENDMRPEDNEQTAAISAYLQDLPVITKEASLSKSSVKDAYGNEYAGPYYDFCSWGQSNKDGEYITQAYMEYNVGGQYRYLTGTVFTRNNQKEEHSIELLVYADDVLVFQSTPLTRRDKALELAVDIGNCDVLRIASRTYEHSGNTNPGIILADGMVCNTFEGKLTEGVEINPDLVPLTDLYVYGDHSNVLDNISAGAVKDSYGNIYKGIYIELVSYGNYGGKEFDTQAYTDFVVGGNYNYFSGTFFTRAEQSEEYAIEFLVYADDKLVYSSGMIDRSTKAVDFCVEIKDCEMLRVMSRSLDYTDSGTNPGIILMDAVVSTEEP